MLGSEIDLIADLVQETLAPILADLKNVQSQLQRWDARWNDLGALRERLAVLEVRAPVPGPPGEKGEQGVPGAMGAHGKDGAAGLIGPVGLPGPPGERGEKGTDGLSVKGEVGPQGERGEMGLKGADGLPGKDGLSVKGDSGPIGPSGEKGLPGPPGTPGTDGTDGDNIVDALIDRAGHLVLTLSTGRIKDVGLVQGKDGANGINGTNVDPLFVQDFVTKELAKWPKPKDGLDGKDGAPGLSPDDFTAEFSRETRALTIKLMRNGVLLKEQAILLHGTPSYKGTYEAGKAYLDGDIVTWNGSVWFAMADTSDRPGNGATAWKCAVKHGDAGPRGPEGKPGRDGRDLVAMDQTGRKYGR